MAGRDAGAAELVREVDQAPHLEVTVADGAGIRCAPSAVLGDEVVDDAREFLGQIDGLERNVHRGRNHARVAGVRQGATGLLVDLVRRDLHAVAHEQADQGVAALDELPRDHGAVHAAAHGDDQLLFRGELNRHGGWVLRGRAL